MTFSGQLSIGRKSTCDIILVDRAISTVHAKINWTVDLRSLPSTELLAGGPSFRTGDTVRCSVTYTDTSTNGTYEGVALLPRGKPASVHTRLFGGDNPAGSLAFQIIPSDNKAASFGGFTVGSHDWICLGKPRITPEGTESKPVFALRFGWVGIAEGFESGDPRSLSPNAFSIFPSFECTKADVLTKFLGPPTAIGNIRRPSGTAGPPGIHGGSSVSGRGFVKVEPESMVSSRNVAVQQATAGASTDLAKSGTPMGIQHTVSTLRSHASTTGAEATALKRQLERLQRESDAKAQELESVKAQVSRALEETQAKARRIVELDAELADSKRQLESVRRQLDRKVSEIEVELDLAVKRSTAANQQLTMITKERDEAVLERSQLKEEVERLQSKQQRALSQVEETESRLQESEGRLTAARAEARKLGSDLTALNEVAAHLRDDLASNAAKLSEANMIVAQLEGRCRDFESVSSRLRNELVARDAYATAMQGQLDQTHARHVQRVSDLNIYHAGIMQIQAQLGSLLQQFSHIDWTAELAAAQKPPLIPVTSSGANIVSNTDSSTTLPPAASDATQELVGGVCSMALPASIVGQVSEGDDANSEGGDTEGRSQEGEDDLGDQDLPVTPPIRPQIAPLAGDHGSSAESAAEEEEVGKKRLRSTSSALWDSNEDGNSDTTAKRRRSETMVRSSLPPDIAPTLPVPSEDPSAGNETPPTEQHQSGEDDDAFL